MTNRAEEIRKALIVGIATMSEEQLIELATGINMVTYKKLWLQGMDENEMVKTLWKLGK